MTEEEYVDKLDALMARILFRLSMVSDGASASLPSASADGDPKAAAAPGKTKGSSDSKILAIMETDWSWEIRKLGRRYKKAVKIDSKRTIIKEGLAMLVQARWAPDRSTRKGTKEWRLRIGRTEGEAKIIAFRFDVSPAQVYRFRAEAKKETAKQVVKSNGHLRLAA